MINDPNRKKRLIKFVFGLNGFLFLLGGSGLIGEGKYIIGLLQLCAGILNLVMLSAFISGRIKRLLSGLILLMNVLVAGSIAYDYQVSGTNYIQYAWMVAAVVSLLAFILYLKKIDIAPGQ